MEPGPSELIDLYKKRGLSFNNEPSDVIDAFLSTDLPSLATSRLPRGHTGL